MNLLRFRRRRLNGRAFGRSVGADQGVAKNAEFKDGVATFIIPKKGLMASAAVGGQKLSFEAAKGTAVQATAPEAK